MVDISKPLQEMGTKTQEVIPNAMTGGDVERAGMRKARALRELAAGQEALGQGIGSALKSIGGALERMGAGDAQDMARQGDIEGRNSVVRDEHGDIQVQPTSASLFGKSGEHYANAAYAGAVNAGRDQLRADLTKIAANNVGNPEGLRAGVDGYLHGHLGGLGSGQVGQTLLLDAKDYGQQFINHSITTKAASDFQSAEQGIRKSVTNQQNDLEALALGGAVKTPAFFKTFADQQANLDSLTGNFGVSRDEVDALRKTNTSRIEEFTLQGAMASAFKTGGLNAAAGVVGSIDARTDISDADKSRLRFAGDAHLEKLKSANASDILTNQTAFNGLMELRRKGAPVQLSDWQDVQKRAVFLGDDFTSKAAMTEITNHHWVSTAVTMSPSQQDRANGVGEVPAGLRNNNPFNIKWIGQSDSIGPSVNTDQGDPQARYANMQTGFRAGQTLITHKYIGGLHTAYEIIAGPKGWTPGNRNSAEGVAREMGVKPDEDLRLTDPDRLRRFSDALVKEEQGPAGLRIFKAGVAGVSGPPDAQLLVGQNKGDINRAVDDAFTKLGSDRNINRTDLKEYLRTGGHNLDPATAAYCAAFVGAALQHAGIRGAPSDIASDYLNWGSPVGRNDIKRGDVLVIVRPGVMPGHTGDHVGFATGRYSANGLVEMISGNTQGGKVATEFINPGAVIARRYDSNAPAMSASRSTTWDDLHNNPGMAPTYIKVLAAETEVRSKYAETLIDSSTRSIQNNTPVSQETMVQIEQLATPEARAANPQLDAKYSEYEKTVVASHIAASGPAVIEQARAEALAQPDMLQRQIVDQAHEIRKGTEAQLKENPVAAALNGKMINRSPVPLDPGNPQTIPLHFAGNAAVVDALSAGEPGFSKSVVFKNEVGAFGATMAGPAQAGLAVLSSLAALPPNKQDATLEMPEVRAAILGMANSTDPNKKRAAFAFMDHIYRQEPQTFEGKFEHKGLLLLRDWQDTQQFHTDEEIAKDAATAYDPSTIRAREALADKADKILKDFTPAAVAAKLAPSWFTDTTPISDVTAQTNSILLEDHNRAFKEMYERHGNETSAYNYAKETIGVKWGPSVANGDRVMAYPPERSPAYPAINGSQDYIGKQLADFVTARGHDGAEAHLIAGRKARDEMISGKPIGYGVVVQGNDKQFVLLDGLFYADPAAAKKESDVRLGEGPLSGRRTAREFFRR